MSPTLAKTCYVAPDGCNQSVGAALGTEHDPDAR